MSSLLRTNKHARFLLLPTFLQIFAVSAFRSTGLLLRGYTRLTRGAYIPQAASQLLESGHQWSAYFTSNWLTYLSRFAAQTTKQKLTELLDSSFQDGVVC